jgi:CheY-like chemotaxis protein
MDIKIKKTCIIDDDDVYIYAIKRLMSLQKLCEDILVFKNGKDAVDYFVQHKDQVDALPDLILIDVNMPILDGWGFINEYLAHGFDQVKNADLYMISSSIDPRDVKKAEALPIIKKYIFKPITLQELNSLFGKIKQSSTS